jgi:hypothetical protein
LPWPIMAMERGLNIYFRLRIVMSLFLRREYRRA